MKITNFRVFLSALCVVSILAGFTKVSAGPVRFDQVVQVMNTRPGQSGTGVISKLRVAGNYTFLIGDDDEPKKKAPEVQDGRVITETRIDVVRDDVCDCEEEVIEGRGFPKFLLLGLAAIPLAFILIRRKKDTPTPTPTPPGMTPTPTPPGMTPTPTPPGMTPTPTPPGMTPTPTPPGMTPTPTPPGMTPSPSPPEPIPEPMTILLFGTGLASVGMAARRRFGKKKDDKDEEEKE